MANKEEVSVLVPKAEYNYLLETQAQMDELEKRGVDNWSGYVGRARACHECDADVPWTEDVCPNCGVALEDYDFF